MRHDLWPVTSCFYDEMPLCDKHKWRYKLLDMKKLQCILILCLFAALGKAQTPSYSTYSAYRMPNVTAYADFGRQVLVDTTVTGMLVDSAGTIRLTDSTLQIDNNEYRIVTAGDVTMDKNDQWWQTLTLSNGYTCILRRYPNYPLMNIIIQPDALTSWCYYIR